MLSAFNSLRSIPFLVFLVPYLQDLGINIKEMRANIGRLDELVDEELELIVSRRGQPIARVLPISRRRTRPDHADLRRRTAELIPASAVLIRAERDER